MPARRPFEMTQALYERVGGHLFEIHHLYVPDYQMRDPTRFEIPEPMVRKDCYIDGHLVSHDRFAIEWNKAKADTVSAQDLKHAA